MGKTKDAIKILDRLTGEDRELRELIEQEAINAQIAELIHDARTKAGLTQQQLADMVGTQQPNIARLEADYSGHSLTMLQRIAKALDQRLEIKFQPLNAHRKAS